LDLIDRAKSNGIKVTAWTADELYGRNGTFLDGLDERSEAFVVEIPPSAHVWLSKPKVLKKPPRNRAWSLRKLLRVAFGRWPVEDCFREAKEELGLDHFECRGWRCIDPEKIKSVSPKPPRG
jgi:SRSO17 transposase